MMNEPDDQWSVTLQRGVASLDFTVTRDPTVGTPVMTGALGDVRSLGQDRCGVRHHLVDRRPGDLRDRLGGLPGSDPRLDVAGAEREFHGSLQEAGR